MLTHILCGGTLVIENRFAFPQVVLETMIKEDVTGFSGVPSNFMILLNQSDFCSDKLKELRYVTQAGGAMAPEIIKKVMSAIPDKEIYIMYGQTEASPRATYLPPEKLKEKIGSIGIEIPGVAIKVTDKNGKEASTGEIGEIVIRGDNVMMGYNNQPEEQKHVLQDGWLFTGDLARRDKDGYLFIVARKKEIIKVGGNRVSTIEIEERILEHEAVCEVAVVGVSDDVLGEAIKAFVVMNDGFEINVKDVQEFCITALARHKAPKYVEFLKELPKLPTGKINKQALN